MQASACLGPQPDFSAVQCLDRVKHAEARRKLEACSTTSRTPWVIVPGWVGFYAQLDKSSLGNSLDSPDLSAWHRTCYECNRLRARSRSVDDRLGAGLRPPTVPPRRER